MTSGRIPPTIKCTNRVRIWAMTSEVKKEEVTYVKGTIPIG